MTLQREFHNADLLIIGGGTAGCYAAITAARRAPEVSVLLIEKADIRRSGCLAAGVNALNAYIPDGRTPEEYVDYVRRDAEIIRDDLVLSMAERFNACAADLERMGLVILKDAEGKYATRGRWNLKINGENIKPLLAAEVGRYPNITVLNHVNVTDYLISQGRVCGAVGFSLRDETAYSFAARAVLCTTGGAAGLYRPNNPGFSRHKTWYPPFNTGAGYAMGIRAGAEMTGFEMRFVALRCKDTIAPTGTIALGVGAAQVNAFGEDYGARYGFSTSARAYGTTQEVREGRGPCYLQTVGIPPEQDADLYRAYLNMAPAQTLRWLESGAPPSAANVELACTEPYIVGGHTGSGYWVDARRRATLPGLYAAGDVSGGAPMKFVTGALAEGQIAAETALSDLPCLPLCDAASAECPDYGRILQPGYDDADTFRLEETMQSIMDEYAGGIGTDYRYDAESLSEARRRIAALSREAADLRASDTRGLLRLYELRDRLTVCQTLIAHMDARRETRWPGFGIRTDYPEQDTAFTLHINSRLLDGETRIYKRGAGL
ncbi:MAG: adenylyl-sulfate reductase subunit alpha [Oscillibacter sp.]|nr:adenylyl-sulfate reductase subunit alpha [Oscillibacter sp.]